MNRGDRAERRAAGTGPVLRLLKFTPLLLILAGVASAFLFDLHDYLSFEGLAERRQMLADLVTARPIATGAAFFLVYVFVVAVSLPVASVLTLFSGFLFGCVSGGVLVVLAATTGSGLLFLAARSVFGDVLRARAGPFLQRFADGFRGHAFLYLLVLRLTPIFPFFVVSIAPAFFDIRLRTFLTATFIGIIPATFVYSWLGSGLDAVMAQASAEGREPAFADFATPQLTLAVLGLAAIAALTAGVKIVIERRKAVADGHKDGARLDG